MATTRVAQHGVDLYRLKINSGGLIDLDSGSGGTVIVRGDLTVQGTTTTIDSAELTVTDKTITINNGETQAGVGGPLNEVAGIVVDRGTESNAHLFFDEAKTFTRNGASVDGAFTLENALGEQVGLYTNNIITLGNDDLLLNTGTGFVTVSGTVDYERQIWNYTGSNITPNALNDDNLVAPVEPDALVNVQGLKDYVKAFNDNNSQSLIAAPAGTGDTRVEAFDTEDGDPTSQVTVSVNGTEVAEFFETRVQIGGINLTSATIETTATNQNLVIRANGTGVVQVTSPFELPKSSDPAAPVDGVRIYSKVEGDGGTGIFFTNELGTTDELISRNKSLLYSIIF
jgi:hypothetical protein